MTPRGGRLRRATPTASVASEARDGFAYLGGDEVYLDSACQSLRPQPVIDAMTEYYTQYNACGDRVKYAWGTRVADGVARTRERVLKALGLSHRHYSCAFTLNTTYGLNLLLQQLPAGRYARIVTTAHEHNAVFLSTITAARRLGIPRRLLERGPDGTIDTHDTDLTDAVVVVSAMDNVTGTLTADLHGLVARTRAQGGIVLLDAAQAAPHALAHLRGLDADAVCFSAHKMYGPALGVVAAANELLLSLDVAFAGGGQIAAVTDDGFELLPEPHTRLEPGLQAWGEILAFGAALDWFTARQPALQQREDALAQRLFDGLAALPNLTLRNITAAPVISLTPDRVDGHRLAVFLSQAGIMVRSGYFCAHHWLQNQEHLPPLVRFSLGAHNTDADIDRALEITGRMAKGL